MKLLLAIVSISFFSLPTWACLKATAEGVVISTIQAPILAADVNARWFVAIHSVTEVQDSGDDAFSKTYEVAASDSGANYVYAVKMTKRTCLVQSLELKDLGYNRVD
ncbi:MAG: hypothetical protein KDD40_11880 [Bdellovibrionales bacterium]|nr:hypothetical protein [Bdellovibrionales bacterium]